MIEVEQIKMRKDIRILHKKYNFTYHALARGLGVSENMIMVGKGQLKNHMTKINLMQTLIKYLA